MDPVIAVLVGYLLGSLPFSVWIARLRGVDLRAHGSGNLGATNVYRVVGWREGLLTLLLDVAKGTAVVLLSHRLVPGSAFVPAVAGLAAVAGHMATPLAGFKGGKGVATGFGVFLGLAPVAALLGVLVWGSVLALSGWVSLASGVAAVTLPLWVGATRDGLGERYPIVLVLAAITAVLVVARHRPNWVRIVEGREPTLWGRRAGVREGEGDPFSSLGGESR